MRDRIVLFLFLFALSAGLPAQGFFSRETIELSPSTLEYKLQYERIVAGSEIVVAGVDTLLTELYRMDYRQGKLVFFSLPETEIVYIEYLRIPVGIGQEYRLYKVISQRDSLRDEISSRRRLFDDPDSNLDISGSKTFALTFSDENAFDLKQSLYVNLQGRLGNNVNILAQLSDSQTKLSPEGDSRELSSLDQVFVKIFGRNYEFAMGDLDWQSAATRFFDYKTSFEGINAAYLGNIKTQLGYSAASGKNAAMRIEIIDGKQGPYYLNSAGYQSSYIVVAGSERIFLDGALLERGTDYTIDYSEGSVMFRRLVLSTNNVMAYYQYSDENFKQNMVFNSFELPLGNRWLLKQNFMYQADSSSQPLLYSYTESDLDSLAIAGDNNAWGSGVFAVDPGTGAYRLLYTSDGLAYYEYAPDDSLASYNLIFSYVGYGNGDYEQFSSGKFQYKGSGQGSWMPQKRLLAPVMNNHLNAALAYRGDSISLSAEASYTRRDRNTLSALDDTDNNGIVLYVQGAWKPESDKLQPQVAIDYERRTANTHLETQSLSLADEIDLAAIVVADSLEQEQFNLSTALLSQAGWNPKLAIRYRNVKDRFTQRALRISSYNPAKDWFPEINYRSTVSEQLYSETAEYTGLYQYHSLISAWQWNIVRLRLDLLYNWLAFDQLSGMPPAIGNSYLKINPALSLTYSKNASTSLSYLADETYIQANDWQKTSTTGTINLRQVLSSLQHNLDLDYSHRDITRLISTEQGNTSFDLIRFRSNHNVLNNAVSLSSNYQLNQTEFFPRIRELEYVGLGLGYYDSTGVFLSGGDYDYTYITSDQGKISSELTAQLNLFLKPGMYLKDNLSRRIQSDTSINLIEITERRNEALSYIFYPGYVFDPVFTIYGKQSLVNNIWLDLWQNRLLLNLTLDLDRSLDQRYQELSRSYNRIMAGELSIRQLRSGNYKLSYRNEYEDDSRYQSLISINSLDLLWQRVLTPQSSIETSISYSLEDGKNAQTNESYMVNTYSLRPSIRTILNRQYRISGQIGLQYNDRSGSDYLSFLPEKRDGFSLTWTLSAIYRLNSFSSFTLQYSGNQYPLQDSKHQLSLEFKAEL